MTVHSGKAIIFSAPSGAGKTTIVHYLRSRFPQLEFSVSATSRPPRGNEQHGADYYFLSQQEFDNRVAAGDFIEWEQVYQQQCYGTLRAEVERIWKKGHCVIFDVDVKGGINLKKIFGANALSIFVKPPSIEALEQRLRHRATEPEEKILMRLAKAAQELQQAPAFDYQLLNAELEKAKAEAVELVAGFLHTPPQPLG
ncbi:MAG: guanylate kinase [Bacteroidia bacterium]|jgi:guanylate kinase|nr:guanylate kinase [Bacteroidia bacterium]